MDGLGVALVTSSAENPPSPSVAGAQLLEPKRRWQPCMTGTYALDALRLPVDFANWASAAAKRASAHARRCHAFISRSGVSGRIYSLYTMAIINKNKYKIRSYFLRGFFLAVLLGESDIPSLLCLLNMETI